MARHISIFPEAIAHPIGNGSNLNGAVATLYEEVCSGHGFGRATWKEGDGTL
jgi:hypothetical protein